MVNYFVRLFFVGTGDPCINAARVAGRVMQGGHTVPIEKIVSRYGKSLAKLSPAIQLADRVYIYDNSVDDVDARLCARTVDGRLRKIYGPLPDWISDVVDPLPRHADLVDLRLGSAGGSTGGRRSTARSPASLDAAGRSRTSRSGAEEHTTSVRRSGPSSRPGPRRAR